MTNDYAEFILLYARSQLRLRYRYALLGRLWNVLEPALYLGVLSVVFSFVNRVDFSNYAIYLFAGLVPWRYLEASINGSVDAIAEGGWLLRKVAAPPVVLPLTRWLMASVDFLISFSLLLVVLTFLAKTWTIHVLVVPLAIVLYGMIGLGVGTAAAVAFVFMRDIRPILQMALMLLFFSSPILIMTSNIPRETALHSLFDFHPLTYLSALFQKPIYFHQWPSTADWSVAIIGAAGSLSVAYYLVVKYRSRFYFYL